MINSIYRKGPTTNLSLAHFLYRVRSYLGSIVIVTSPPSPPDPPQQQEQVQVQVLQQHPAAA